MPARMMTYVRWRRWLRTFVVLLIISLIIMRVWHTRGYNNSLSTIDAVFAKSNKDTLRSNNVLYEHQNGREIHIVVGHYVGDDGNFGVSMQNLSQEQLNSNLFSPRPGEGKDGHAVLIPPQENAQMQQLFLINRFNLLASDRIPLNRSLPDVRRKRCQDYYNTSVNVGKLPDVSVIIVFHNEAWSTLLRTVTSVVNRSPRNLLREIILIDDASEREFLGKPLEEYLKKFEVPTCVLRTHVRSGLVRARLLGARAASGEILVFLDAHCECTIGWLEPLVMPVAEDRTKVVCPVIDIINDNTFAYVRSFELHWGAFNWHLHFRWYTLGNDEIKRRKRNTVLPYKTPVMAGGLYAIDRSYFFEVGSYDEDMDIWGGENLEMSFRVWQCGGSVEIAPCSHVGHLFRKSSPYSFPGGIGDILHTNLARVALVWMDEWAEFFFRFSPDAARLRNSVSVSKRLQLRHRLQCRNFHWYLNAVWPEHFFPMEDRFFGQIHSKMGNKCLQKPEKSLHQPVGALSVESCYNYSDMNHSSSVHMLTQQLFVFNSNGLLMTDESVCMDASILSQPNKVHGPKVNLIACSGNDRQKWNYDHNIGTFVHNATGLCLELQSAGTVINSSLFVTNSNSSSDILTLNHCHKNSSQQWYLRAIPWK